MDVKDYCRNVEMELISWKARLYDAVKKVDQMPTGSKQRLRDQIDGFHILMTELDDRIDQLHTECPTEWNPQREAINAKIDEIKDRWKTAEKAMFDYDFGG